MIRYEPHIFRTQTASVLIGLLWCLVLLSVVVVGVLHAARMDLRIVKNHGDRIQAHYLAVAGIEKAKALLYQDARERSRSGSNHSGKLNSAPDQFRDIRFGRGQFTVFRPGTSDEGGSLLYGVGDEESRLNVNTVSEQELKKLRNMTPDVASAIMDWRDSDNTVSPGGAEIEYYMSQQPPCRPRNGPFLTIRELLMVRGVTRQLLFGAGKNRTDAVHVDLESPSADTTAQMDNTAWANLLTVHSSIGNKSASGTDRVDIQTADETTLTTVRGITAPIAKAIISHRGQNRFNSVADLLDVVAAQEQNQPNANRPGQVRPPAPTPGPGSQPGGAKLISENLLMEIADDVTVQSGEGQNGVVNINTASLEVLACLPGLDRDLAQAVISFRQSNGYLANVAWLLKVPGINANIFKQIAPRVCARSETFRIICEGRVTSTGTRQRIQEIVHVDVSDVKTVSYREDDL